MRRRLWLTVAALVALVALAIVSLASAKQQTVSGKVTITGSGTNWTLTFENAASSTGSIKCWRYTFPPGVMAAGIGKPPDGWQVGGNKPPPAPILAGKSNAGIPPGGKASFPIITDKPFDTGGPPGIAAISEDCISDGAAQVMFGAQPPPPEPKKCVCKDLKATIVGNRISFLKDGPKGIQLEILTQWTMTCTKGAGKCEGELTLVPSVRAKNLGVTVTAPAGGKVTCSGPCTKSTKNLQNFVVTAGPKLGSAKRGKSVSLLRLEMKRVCKSTRTRQIFEIVFTKAGGIDAKRSDLNANGIQDRKDR